MNKRQRKKNKTKRFIAWLHPKAIIAYIILGKQLKVERLARGIKGSRSNYDLD